MRHMTAINGEDMLCLQNSRGLAQPLIYLIQNVEYDSTAGEASHIQGGNETSLAREQVADVELCQVVCDATKANDHCASWQCIEAVLGGAPNQDEACHVEQGACSNACTSDCSRMVWYQMQVHCHAVQGWRDWFALGSLQFACMHQGCQVRRFGSSHTVCASVEGFMACCVQLVLYRHVHRALLANKNPVSEFWSWCWCRALA